MPKTNDELYDDLIEQALLLTRTNEYGTSRERMKKLREVVFLMEAYTHGENIVHAKLRMTDDDLLNQVIAPLLRKHLSGLYRQEDVLNLREGVIDEVYKARVISDAQRCVLKLYVMCDIWSQIADDYIEGNLE